MCPSVRTTQVKVVALIIRLIFKFNITLKNERGVKLRGFQIGRLKRYLAASPWYIKPTIGEKGGKTNKTMTVTDDMV